MDKPKNYDNVKSFGEFEPLEAGGHICRIVKVEETLSRSGKEMIVIYIDTAEGRQKNYFKKIYDNDTRENKRWGCVVYQLVHDRNGDTNRGFKTFNTSVEKSNAGFKIVWGEKYCESFKDKLIGAVFGREQYKNQNGELVWSTKCFSFRTVEEIRKGVAVPKDRLYKYGTENNTYNKNPYYAEDVSDDDDDLPF